MIEIVSQTLEKKELRFTSSNHQQAVLEGQRQAELYTQPIYMFEKFYDTWEYSDNTDKFHDSFKEELASKLES